MSVAAIGAIAAPLIAGFMGQDAARDKQLAADEARRQALAQFANLEVPDIEKQKLMLQEYQLTGQMTPELEALINLGPSAMEQVSMDPRLRSQQMNALEAMSGLASGQVTPADMAGFEMARRNSAAEAQAKDSQIMQNMQQRGQGGSGAELMARLQSNQSGADRLQQAQLEEAKAMQNARIAALSQQANMASNLRTQDYGEQTNLAKARDLINQFNTQNSQNVQQRNVGTRNQAQQLNLQNQQNNANMNTNIRNKQQISNKDLLQQDFNNRRSLASDRAGAYGTNANASDARAAQTAGMWARGGQAVASGIAAWNKQPSNNENDEMTQFELDNMED